MSAEKVNYAIIAGSGRLPEILAEKLDAKIISFIGQDLDKLQPDLLVNIGYIGETLNFLEANNINKIIFAGSIKKPKLADVKTDAVGKKLLAKIALSSMFGKKLPGDDALLSKIIQFLEKQGYEVVGTHEAAPELLADEGKIVGDAHAFADDIKLGIKAAKELGEQDLGQGVVVFNREVIAKEGEEGTEALIKSVKGGVLVKCKKPQQEMRIDLPTIGVETIEQLKNSGLSGVAVEANVSLILDKDAVINKAAEYGIFVVGV